MGGCNGIKFFDYCGNDAKVLARSGEAFDAKVIARSGAGVIARNDAIFLVCWVRDFFRVQFASAMGSDGTQ
ncbi:MAG: hypothetical protein B6D37_02925 [Sphingobacteriales bacterium UTBCD1]|nr:MAG: hypothetical protein B6D37_02925 [Sphingobacteriales bacterium UTBCD1]